MPLEGTRRSDRVDLRLPIRISGIDALGRVFLESAETLVVNRHGAKIRATRKLTPDQEISIQRADSGEEADGRVVGQLGREETGFVYGVSLLNPTGNPWGMDSDSGESQGTDAEPVRLECLACHAREVASLDGLEVEVLKFGGRLARYCERCTDSTLWVKCGAAGEVATARHAPRRFTPRVDRRREPRRSLRVTACVRSREFGEEIVWTRDVSRGGLSFEGHMRYDTGGRIEVALPYFPHGGNSFLPAEIKRVQRLSTSDANLYGVAYAVPQA